MKAASPKRTMFSTVDLQELLQTFPSPLVHFKNEDNPSYISDDQLIRNASGTGFVRSRFVATELERLLVEVVLSGKLEVARVAKSLNVAPENVLRLVTHPPIGPVLVTRDQRFILKNETRNNLLTELYREASTTLIDPADFLTKNDILDTPGLDLASMYDMRIGRYDSSSRRSLHYLDTAKQLDMRPHSKIYSHTLYTVLKDTLRQAFQEAHNEARARTMLPADFKDVPVFFVEMIARECLAEEPKADWQRGELSTKDNSVIYTPESHARGHATRTLEAMAIGDRSYLEYHEFESLRATAGLETTAFSDEVTTLPREQPRWVVSNLTLERWRKNAQAVLSEQDFVLLGSLKFELPTELESLIIATLANSLTAGSSSVKSGDAVVSDTLFERLSSSMENAARAQASEDWKQGVDRLLNNERIQAILAADLEVKSNEIELATRILSGESRKNLLTVYANTASELAAATEQEFESFWTEKVASRAQLYRLGLDNVADAKLREQLGELLRTHITKELVPEQTSKAKMKSLVRSKKTIRETEKLQEKLQQATSLTNAFEALDKFSSKQSKRLISDDSIEKAKETHVLDLYRGMRKDKDSARLFLTLVIVLLAKHKAGVTYATGKYAPKLLKLLKGLISDNIYQELNELKEKVKAGSVTVKDQARMQELTEL